MDLACLFRQPANLKLVMHACGFLTERRRGKDTFTVQGWGTKTTRRRKYGFRGPIPGIFLSECSSSDNLGLQTDHFESFVLGLKFILSFPNKRNISSEST